MLGQMLEIFTFLCPDLHKIGQNLDQRNFQKLPLAPPAAQIFSAIAAETCLLRIMPLQFKALSTTFGVRSPIHEFESSLESSLPI